MCITTNLCVGFSIIFIFGQNEYAACVHMCENVTVDQISSRKWQ